MKKKDPEPDVRAPELPSAEALRSIGAGYPDFDPLAVESLLALTIVAGEIQARMEPVFRDHGLTRARFFFLLLLRSEGGPLTPADLAARTSTTTASMASLLEGLVAAGLIRRQPRKDDRRSHFIHLTAKGDARVDAVLPHVYRAMRDAMSPLGERAQRDLVRLLTTLREGPGDRGGKPG